MHYGLIYRGNRIPLGHAPTVIGRSTSCKIMLDDTEVSRRHARLLLIGDRLLVEDLDSANGVFVNGKRIEEQQQLTAGDRIVVGGHQFEVTNELSRKSVKRKRFVTPYAKNQVRRSSVDRLWDDEDVVETGGESTSERSKLELMAQAAETLFEDDRPSDAEELLRPVLLHLLEVARKRKATDAWDLELAVRCALRLARATGRVPWVDWVFELFSELRQPLPKESVDDLWQTLEQLGNPATDRMRDYVAVLSKQAAKLDSAARGQLDRLRAIAQPW